MNKHAVACIYHGEIAGPVPHNYTVSFHFCLKCGGEITAKVVGFWETVGAGLEIPSVYTFSAAKVHIDKLHKLLWLNIVYYR